MNFMRLGRWLILVNVAWLVACAGQPSLQTSVADDGASTRSSNPFVEQHKQLAKRYETAADFAAAETEWHILTLLAPDEPAYRRSLIAAREAISRNVSQTYQSGQAALRKGQMEEATQAMLRVLALSPTHAEAAQTLRDIERAKIGRIQADRAARVKRSEETTANRQTQTPPRQGYDLDQLIELFNAGDTNGGLREMQRYVEANPGDKAGRQRIATIVYDYGRKLDEQKQSEAALPFYERAIALRGDKPASWDVRAKAIRKALADEYYAKGLRIYHSDLAQAIRYWESCLGYDPKYLNASLRIRDAKANQERLMKIGREK